jgi:molybdopterin molybdotransferase
VFCLLYAKRSRKTFDQEQDMPSHHPPHVPWAEARRIAGSARALPSVEVSLEEAVGGTLAAALQARTAVPAFDTAAMDGYAVAGPGAWTLTGRVLAGAGPGGPLSPGECTEIATGAAVPPGSDAVLPYEESLRRGDQVDQESAGELRQDRHIRRRGEDCPEGTHLAQPGQLVTPALAGLAASVGHDTLEVVRRPQVVVLLTGDEVVQRGAAGPGHVRDAIGPMLPSIVAETGGIVMDRTGVADDEHAVEKALQAPDADVLAVCGSSSSGPADHLRRVLTGSGADLLVGGVACRPGHPQLLARTSDGRWVVGLPGNPFAALVATVTLLVPLLEASAGRRPPAPQYARLHGEVRPHPRDTRLVAVRRFGDVAHAVGHDRPGVLWGAALADALAVVPPGWDGEPVELVALPGLGHRSPGSGQRLGSAGVTPPSVDH